VPDPEDERDPATGLRGIDQFENFMRLLAQPARGPISPQVQRGQNVFMSVGCGSCHFPQLVTGPNANPLFNRKPVPAYSDFLLHEIGTGDGIGQAAAQPNEIRTPALWGLRFRGLLLHDGEALTPLDAIQAHRNEAERSRQRYFNQSRDDRAALLAFLDSL